MASEVKQESMNTIKSNGKKTLIAVIAAASLLLTVSLATAASVKSDIREFSRTTNARMDKMEESVDANTQMIGRLDERWKAIANDIQEIKVDIRDIKIALQGH